MAKKLLKAAVAGVLTLATLALSGCAVRSNIVLEVNGTTYDEAAFNQIKDTCSAYNVASGTDTETWVELVIIADTAPELADYLNAATTRDSAVTNLATLPRSAGALQDPVCKDFVVNTLWAVTMIQKDLKSQDNPYINLIPEQDIVINPRYGRVDPTQMNNVMMPLTLGSFSQVGDRPYANS
jgi:hypothetical protein